MPDIVTVCTYCSAPKRTDAGLLPAGQRYLSSRISDLMEKAAERGQPFLILSGEYGVITADTPIPWYDHLLLPDEVVRLVPRVVDQLRSLRTMGLEYHTVAPEVEPAVQAYLDTLTQACRELELPLHIVNIQAPCD